jgi:hypothetical protein
MPSPLWTAVGPRRLEFRDAQSVEMHREILMAEIQKKKRVNGTERIYEYIKELAASPLDLGFAETWETVIKYADDGLEEEYMDEERTEEQRLEDTRIVADSDDSEGEDEYVEAEDFDMSATVRLGSWNPEKLGKSTVAADREDKKSHTLNTLDTYNPTFLGLMEISDANFFFEGSKYKPGVAKGTVPYYNERGTQELKNNREFSATKREDKLGYKPSATYGMYEGPRFESGTYGENYPAMYNKSQIIGTPTCFTVDLGSKQETNFDLSTTQPAITFSTEQKINRRLVVWKLDFNASPWSFRPVPGREIPVVTFYVGVIHTSPSINIKNEIENVLQVAQQISDRDGIPMAIVGDFYMQRSATQIWDSLHSDNEEYWQIVHPQRNTNFPHQGEGQIADHSLADKEAFTNARSFSVPPLKDSLQPISKNPTDLKQKEYEKYYTGMGVDHTTVMNDFSLNLASFEESTYTEPHPANPRQLQGQGLTELQAWRLMNDLPTGDFTLITDHRALCEWAKKHREHKYAFDIHQWDKFFL